MVSGALKESIVASSATPQPAPVETRRREKYDRLLATAKALPRLRVAVAHPCDATSLGATLEAASLGIIDPILVGPQDKIHAHASIARGDGSKGQAGARPVHYTASDGRWDRSWPPYRASTASFSRGASARMTRRH